MSTKSVAMKVRRALQVPGLKDITQEAMAHLLGVSFPTINAWERGRSAPGRDNADLLALLWDVLQTHPPVAVRGILGQANGSRPRLVNLLYAMKHPAPTTTPSNV